MSRRMYLMVLVVLAATGFVAAWVFLDAAPVDQPPLRGVPADEIPAEDAVELSSSAPAKASPEVVPNAIAEAFAGFSGTLEFRAPFSTESPVRKRAVTPRLKWDAHATDAQVPGVIAGLPSAHNYSDLLARMAQIAAARMNWGNANDGEHGRWHPSRFELNPDQLVDPLLQAFAASKGVARQNLIFHLSMALPERIAKPWLWDLVASQDREDSEDALSALAFGGDLSAVARYATLPSASCNCRRMVNTIDEHEILTKAGERDFLRSYRCIEVLFGHPYFHLHSLEYSRLGSVVPFPWAENRAAAYTAERAMQILPEWMRRYPGHPGTDDMCYRLALHERHAGRLIEAAEWASRGATEPDQDMKAACTALLLSLAEFDMTTADLDALPSGPSGDRNLELIHYIRLRREAVEQGFDSALRMAGWLTNSHSDSVIATAYRGRWSISPPRGLKSGIIPLAETDPLMAMHGVEVATRNVVNPAARYGSGWYDTEDDRPWREKLTNPSSEAVQLPTWRIALQFRLWETQAELMRRRARTAGEEQADLEYKIGAVFYHCSWVTYPLYADFMRNSGLPDPRSGTGSWKWTDDQKQSLRKFREGASSWAQAARRFEELADRHPHSALRDKALFSAGMARIKLVNDWPWAPQGSLVEYIPEGVRLFERVTAEHPNSSLADDAASAAQYWRRNFKRVFQTDTVVSSED